MLSVWLLQFKRDVFFGVIRDYPIILFLSLIACNCSFSRESPESFLRVSDCHSNQSHVAADEMIARWHSGHPCPEMEGRFNPFRMTTMEWTWEGRCIKDEWAVGLCKEACKLYLHEQQVAKRTTLGSSSLGIIFDEEERRAASHSSYRYLTKGSETPCHSKDKQRLRNIHTYSFFLSMFSGGLEKSRLKPLSAGEAREEDTF